MAKNKSPRKHYRPKPCYVPLWTEKDKSNIKAIQAGVAVAGPYINDSIDAIPGETVREFFAMKHLTRGKDARYAYSPEQLRRAIDRNTTIEWSQK